MNLLYMSNIDIDTLLNQAIFKFAKSMPEFPHDYTLKDSWADKDAFSKCALHIYENGKTESFFKTLNKYYYANGYKYWCYAMVNPDIDGRVHWTEKKRFVSHDVNHYAENLCILINRVKV